MSENSNLECRLERGRKLVAEQRRRVERQCQFVSDLEASGHCENVLRDARELLRQMMANLEMMLRHLRRIEPMHPSAAET